MAEEMDGGATLTTSATGGQKGSKPARFDLIPTEPLWMLAELYGKGAEKYTKYGECTCVQIAGNESLTQGGYVEPVTTDGSSQTMPNTQNGKNRTPRPGSRKTKSKAQKLSLSGNRNKDPEHTRNMESREKSTTNFSLSPVGSVVPNQNISTTTTNIANEDVEAVSGGRYVTDVTLVSGTSKDGLPITNKQHLPGCPATIQIESGDDNWRKGYDWKYSYAAAQRHLNQFWDGEDIDPEMQLPHVISAAWHCFTLAQFMIDHREYDPRAEKRKYANDQDS